MHRLRDSAVGGQRVGARAERCGARPRRQPRTSARAERASAASSAAGQSRASAVTTTVPALSVFSSTRQRLSTPPRGPFTSRQLHAGARHQPGQAAQHEAQPAHGHVAPLRALRVAGFEEHLHRITPSQERGDDDDRAAGHGEKAENSWNECFREKLSMSLGFSYRHLYYFWVVAKEGGISRAAARLDMAVQTVSTQVRELERALGHALLKPAGRGLALTEAGAAAMRQADQIFQLGEQLPELLRDAASAPGLRLAVGISDGLPKLVVRRLLQPVLDEPKLRLLCHEDDFERPAGRPGAAPAGRGAGRPRRAAAPEPQASTATRSVRRRCRGMRRRHRCSARGRRGFPQSLAQAAGAAADHARRGALRLDQWFERLGLRPQRGGRVRGQRAAGHLRRRRHGRVPAPDLIHDELSRALRGQAHRRLRRRRGALLRHRHRAQDPAPAGAAAAAAAPVTACVPPRSGCCVI